MNLVIRGGRLIDPANQIDAVLDLYIADGRVAGVGEAPAGFRAERQIDAGGQVVCPGLIDLQAHLREPGLTQKGNIDSETSAAAAGGITTLCCPPSTLPIMDTPAVAKLVQDRSLESAKARVLPLAALTKGLEGAQLTNMVAMKEAGCVAFTNGLESIRNNQTLMRCLEYAATFDMLLFVKPQDADLSAGGCAHEGEIADRLGLPGISETAETVDVARYLLLAEQTGVRIHFGQLSSQHSVQLIRDARARGLAVSADVAVHHLLYCDEVLAGFDSTFHVIPPLRSSLDRAGLREAVLQGALDAICSDHQPHEAAAKAAPFGATEPGISGLETLLPQALKLVEQGVLTLDQLIAKLTQGPAAVLGLELGSLAVGRCADICIFDPDKSWQLSEQSIHSRGMNTPLLNQALKGQVMMTLLQGRVVFELGE